MANDNDATGEVIYEDTNYSCSRIANGEHYNEYDEVFTYQFDNLDIELLAGTYFLACRPVSSSIYWLNTDSQTGGTAYYIDDENPEWTIFEVYADLVFCLFATTGGGENEYLPGDVNMSTGLWSPAVIGFPIYLKELRPV